MQAWQRLTFIAAAVTALHGAALWAAGSYRAPAALQRTVDALLTRTVEPPKPVDVELPKPPAPKVTPPAQAAAPPMAIGPKSPPKPAAQAATTPPAAAPLAVLTSPSGAAPAPAPAAAPPVAVTAAPTAPEAAPAAAIAAPIAPAPQPAITQPAITQPAITQLPSTIADHADTQYRIPLPAISTRLGEAGRVIVRVQVGLDGKALQVQLKTSSGFARLDDNALATVARWRFKPGTRGGAPEVMWVEQPVNYAAQ